MSEPIFDTQLPIQPQAAPPEQLPQILQVPPKKSPIPSIILSVVIIILLGGMGYFVYQYFMLKNQLAIAPAPTPSPKIETADPTANWKTYTNKTYGYSLRYPSDKLTLCGNYNTETDGPRFWNAGFDCVEGHDVSYIIGVVNSKKYDSYGYKPTSTVAITVDNKPATKNIFTYSPNDGPLGELKESEQVIIQVDQGVINLQRFGQDAWRKEVFTQILSTIKFTETKTLSSGTREELIQFLINKVSQSAKVSQDKVDIKINKFKDSYAMGTESILLSEGTPGGVWFAAYQDGGWVLVEETQEPPQCTLMNQYHFPKEMYESCTN